MPNINWEMMTQFTFPEVVGIAEEVVSVDVIPRWQQVDTDESVRLTGIYHIKATVKFNPKIKPEYSEGTFIEHLDLKGDEGYFEYAMPLEVDLPREKVASGDQPELTVHDISFFVYDGSSCTFKWEVKCKFEEPVEGALFQIESEKELVEQAAVVSAQKVAENSGETKEETAPSSLEHKLVNEVLQQAKVESSSYKEITVDQIDEEKIIEGLQHPSFESSTHVVYEEPISNIDFVEEAKMIRQEAEDNKQVTNQEIFDEKWTIPSDTDDFYNELSESYSLLKFK